MGNLYVWVTDKSQTVGSRSDCGDSCNAENKLPKFIDADNAYRNHMCGGDVAKAGVLLKGKTSNLIENTDGVNITKVRRSFASLSVPRTTLPRTTASSTNTTLVEVALDSFTRVLATTSIRHLSESARMPKRHQKILLCA